MIVNIADLKRVFKIEGNTDDDILFRLVTAAEKTAEKYCDTKLKAVAITEYHDGDGSDTIILKNIPVNSVTTVHDDVDRAFGADSLKDSENYVIESWGGIRLLTDLFTCAKQNVKVVYNAGFEVVPEDIKTAISNLAFASYVEANAGVNAIVAEDFVYRPEKLRKAAYAILDQYKRTR